VAYALALLALAAACVGGGQKRLTAEELAHCGARGAPVTVAKLVKVLRSNGITAELNERKCEEPLASAVAQVTNGGFDGLQPRGEIVAVEGMVLCLFDGGNGGRVVEVFKYPDDEETYARALNVTFAVCPSDEASERRQVQRLKRGIVRATPTSP
jgi:hypothetical protein